MIKQGATFAAAVGGLRSTTYTEAVPTEGSVKNTDLRSICATSATTSRLTVCITIKKKWTFSGKQDRDTLKCITPRKILKKYLE